MERRVVVTGMGTVNPLANGVEEYWHKVKNLKNGISRVSRFDASSFNSQVAGEVNNISPEHYIERKEIRRMDRFTLFAVVSSLQAATDAGIANGSIDGDRFGVVIGNGIGGVESLTTNYDRLNDRGPKGIYPLLGAVMIPNIAAGNIAIKLNARGPCHTVATACSSSADAIGLAFGWIKGGTADVMIAGGTEAPLIALGLATFCALKALSTRYNDSPENASRPFDANRDGFVLSEGAGVLVLEEREHALRRGADIYAELSGYGATCDANHLTAPDPEGQGAIRAMRAALQSAQCKPADVDYINAHGTSTAINDRIETRAIKAVFGEHANKLKISSTKSMIGHLLGGSGGAEAVVTVLALHHQFYPGTRNLEFPDPECDLDYLPNAGLEAPMRVAMSNSFGFGGHNAVLLFQRH